MLVQVDRVFKQFRGRFLGKSSPAHFFWGSFDLAVTRFSGRRAPMWNGEALNVNPHVMHESYAHEASSAGFWPGDASVPAMFYSYSVPEPAGFRDASVPPAAAGYNTQVGQFVLPQRKCTDVRSPRSGADELSRNDLRRGGRPRALEPLPPGRTTAVRLRSAGDDSGCTER